MCGSVAGARPSPGRVSTGPGTAMPTPQTALAPWCCSSNQSKSVQSRSSDASAPWARSMGSKCSVISLPERSARPTPSAARSRNAVRIRPARLRGRTRRGARPPVDSPSDPSPMNPSSSSAFSRSTTTARPMPVTRSISWRVVASPDLIDRKIVTRPCRPASRRRGARSSSSEGDPPAPFFSLPRTGCQPRPEISPAP